MEAPVFETASLPQATELERRFPSLRGHLPRLPLTVLPTPVQRWQVVSDRLGSEVWIKRDDETSPVYGGNKPRKLEFLLAEAQRRGCRGVLTFGGLGTHHGLATAIFARKIGMHCLVGLLYQPVTPAVRDNLLWLHAAGARMFYARTIAGLAGRALVRYAGEALRGQRPGIIPTGGSSAPGTVAFVNAGLELATQVERGECPCPTTVYVALGSGGTAAGLALGFALANLPTEVCAVLVSDIVPPNQRRLTGLARSAWEWLRRHGAEFPAKLPPLRLRVVEGFVGRGYGWPSAEAERWREHVGREGEVQLDSTYTAKCFQAMVEEIRAGKAGTHPLFWHTFSRVRPEQSLGPQPDFHELPRPFHRFFLSRPGHE